ncbi:hypothetical protein [uncultured Vibrio sp.]|uniref:hypothetical protein n=1 Tax=uncultured Vibrio sp. TaxID=114054 RepID=UPI0025DA2072|nr:hypothetical protein [uncultured Vibrio sp.]
MYELTLILSLIVGSAQTTAETDVNRQFTTLEQCEAAGATLASQIESKEVKTIQVYCELD